MISTLRQMIAREDLGRWIAQVVVCFDPIAKNVRGLTRLVRSAPREPVSYSSEHAHWDSATRQWVVRGEELDRAA